jgi:hypothetical protein
MMLTTARQFFDIWAECAQALAFSRQYGAGLVEMSKTSTASLIRERYGDKIAAYAEAYYERLRVDTRSGSAHYERQEGSENIFVCVS